MSLRRKFPSVPVGLLEVSSCEHQWLLPGNLIDVHLEHIESRKRKTQSLCLWGSWTLIHSLPSPFHVCLFYGSLQEKRFQSKTASSQVVCGYKLSSSKSSHLNFSISRRHNHWGLWLCIVWFLAPFLLVVIAGCFLPRAPASAGQWPTFQGALKVARPHAKRSQNLRYNWDISEISLGSLGYNWYGR